jgi:hypothetical protein
MASTAAHTAELAVSASNLYMPMIWLYVFLLDFLIPFLCDPDLQCTCLHVDKKDYREKLDILHFWLG